MKVVDLNQMRDEESRYKICKESVLTIPIVVYTKKNFYLLEALNSIIENLKSSGFIELWQIRKDNDKFLKSGGSNQPQILRTSQFFGSVQVLMIGCVISFMIFVTELILHTMF